MCFLCSLCQTLQNIRVWLASGPKQYVSNVGTDHTVTMASNLRASRPPTKSVTASHLLCESNGENEQLFWKFLSWFNLVPGSSKELCG